MYTLTSMTKNKTVPKNKKYFEKIAFSFFTFAYAFMFVSFGYFYLNKPTKLSIPKDISINFVGVGDENDDTEATKINTFSSRSNPNVSDASLREKILKSVGRSETTINYLVIDANGKINSPELSILVGDTVSFLNSTNETVTINFGNFKLENIGSGQILSQDFFNISTYTYTVEPFNTKGTITVLTSL